MSNFKFIGSANHLELIESPFIKLQHPFTCIVAAPTKAGKTTFVARLVNNSELMISPKPNTILWCYNEWQTSYEQLAATLVTFHKGLPDVNQLKKDPNKAKLLIFDDLMSEVTKSSTLTELFTRGCHHWSCSIIHITQDIFSDRKRTNRINAQYLVLMKNPADKLTSSNIAKQMFPGKVSQFQQIFNHATRNAHGYLFIDLDQATPEKYRLRTNIFPDELTIVYELK